MVVWADGRMKKSDYRKFIIRSAVTPGQSDDFASLREAVERRYSRSLAENKPLPGLILIDGGIGQLHAAAEALEKLQIINQPLASIAKKEEIIYVLGQEDEPVKLERHSPILHLIQQIRDETHRFAVTFHQLRRGKRQVRSALLEIPGVGQSTAKKLLRKYGSVAHLREIGLEELSKVVTRPQAERILRYLRTGDEPPVRKNSEAASPLIKISESVN
jgi:excinuclease ABC subunit C